MSAQDVKGFEAGLHFSVRFPSADQPKPWPLLLFLHGAGERGDAYGNDIWRVFQHGPWKGPGSECFLRLAPQCPSGCIWPAFAPEVGRLVRQAFRLWPVDQARVYATGLSLGGFGVWSAASENPGLFAALVPLCGAFTLPTPREVTLHALLNRAKLDVRPEEIAPLRSLPVWLFHGDRDKTVDVNGSKAAYAAMGGKNPGSGRSQQPNPRLEITIYREAGHNIWKSAYNSPELYRWLLQHRREIDAPCADEEPRRAALPEVAANLLGVRARSPSCDSADGEPEDTLCRDLHSMQPALGPALGPAEVREHLAGEEDEDDSGDEDEEYQHMKRVARSMRALVRAAHPVAKSASSGAGAASRPQPGGAAPARDAEQRARGEKRKSA